MHHFNRHLGFEGADGRGRCAAANCKCTSYQERKR